MNQVITLFNSLVIVVIGTIIILPSSLLVLSSQHQKSSMNFMSEAVDNDLFIIDMYYKIKLSMAYDQYKLSVIKVEAGKNQFANGIISREEAIEIMKEHAYNTQYIALTWTAYKKADERAKMNINNNLKLATFLKTWILSEDLNIDDKVISEMKTFVEFCLCEDQEIQLVETLEFLSDIFNDGSIETSMTLWRLGINNGDHVIENLWKRFPITILS